MGVLKAVHVGFRELWLGQPQRADACAIALAIKKVIPGADVRVTGSYAFVNDVRCSLPGNATLAVRMFDSSRWTKWGMLPFSFMLDVPMEAIM